MAIDKNKLIRYRVYDRCFSNFNVMYTRSMLRDKVNEALRSSPNTLQEEVGQNTVNHDISPNGNFVSDMRVFMEDVCFFLIAAIAEVLAIYYLNDGEIRIYCLLFSVIGFFCYQKTIGFVIIFFAKKLLCWFRKIICFFVFLILDPIVFITRKIGKIFSSIIQK